MRSAYTLSVRMKPTTHENEMQCTKKEMGIHLMGTAVTRTAIHQKQAGALMRLRSILRHGHPTEYQDCAFCGNGKKHTATHVIAECEYNPIKTTRTRLEATMTGTVTNYLTNLTTSKLAAVMGGPPPVMLNLVQRLQACEMALTLFDMSPLFNQVYTEL